MLSSDTLVLMAMEMMPKRNTASTVAAYWPAAESQWHFGVALAASFAFCVTQNEMTHFYVCASKIKTND
jgi:hypothetical protein